MRHFDAINRKAQLRQRSKLFCLVWLLLAQVPIPYVHSHEGLANLDSLAYQRHLSIYHAHQEVRPAASLMGEHGNANANVEDDLHWHLILPWDLAMRDADHLSQMTPPTIEGIWLLRNDEGSNAIHELLADSELNHSCVGFLPRACIAGEAARESARLNFRVGSGRSFAQSFLDISIRELVCVCLI